MRPRRGRNALPLRSKAAAESACCNGIVAAKRQCGA